MYPAYKPSNVFKMYRTTSFIQQDFAKKQQIPRALKNKQYSKTWHLICIEKFVSLVSVTCVFLWPDFTAKPDTLLYESLITTLKGTKLKNLFFIINKKINLLINVWFHDSMTTMTFMVNAKLLNYNQLPKFFIIIFQ